jgi:hypothetical protein
MEAINSAIERSEEELQRVLRVLESLGSDRVTKLRELCGRRAKLESQLTARTEEADSRKEQLEQLEESIHSRRNQISNLLANQGKESDRLQSTLAQLKEECTAMELRIRLGLHELNRDSSKGL